MAPVTCQICKGERWLCEDHPDQPYEHDGCRGCGIPCKCNPNQEMPPGFRVERDIERGRIQ